MAHLRYLLLLMPLVLLSGCESIRYYSQAVSGQLSIINKRQDIEQVIEDTQTSPLLKERLQQVQKMRSFAEATLLLPVDDSYSSYVDIERDYVVWNVYAAEELSLSAKTWCFPVTGCIAYRGYFSQEPAVKKAKELKTQGYDVQVGGVRAYSTLGWFDDPILNTFINDDELDLAGLLFHELAHRQLYFKNDTGFNESFATAISDIGLQLWIEQHQERYNASSFTEYLQERQRRGQLTALLNQYRDKLEAVYQNEGFTDAQKRVHKADILQQLDQAYQQLKPQLNTDRYDAWMGGMNNAKLANVNNYTGQVAAFKQLYARSNHDLTVFYQRVLALEDMAPEARPEALQTLINSH